MRWLLKPFELLYRGINRIRRSLYRRGIIRSKKLPVPVISVGNLTLGGGGKTPAVIAIARALSEGGLRVGVLIRGYGRRGPGGMVERLDSDRYGDEPVLIKKNVPKADVIVGANRYENALRQRCDVFLLDDGFQHMQIARDLDLVIEPSHPGFLREGRSALHDADIVIPRRLRLSIPDSHLAKPVFAFAGLANNEQFFTSLREAGVRLVATRGFRDHHRYTREDIEAVKREAAGAAIVTTEKDAVKIDDPSIIAIPAEMIIEPFIMERIVAVARR